MRIVISIIMALCLFDMMVYALNSAETKPSISAQLKAVNPSQPSETPDSIREQAYDKIRIGYDIFNRATQVAQKARTEESMKVAIELYAQAGQTFQEAYNILKFLGTDYVRQEDIDGVKNAVDACVQSIKNAKMIISKR